MRSYILLLVAVILLPVIDSVDARSVTGPAADLAQYNRYVEGEVLLTIELYTLHSENRNIIKAPVLLHYNIHDLRIFKKNAARYVSLFKKSEPSLAMLGASHTLDGRGRRKGWQSIYAEELSRGYEEIDGARRLVTEKHVSGHSCRGIEFILSIPDLRRKVKGKKHDYDFVLMFRDADGAKNEPPHCEGYQKLFIPGMGEQTITEELHVEFSLDKMVYAGSSGKAALPKLDGVKLMNFLMNPVRETTFKISGETHFGTEQGGGRARYYGTLVLKGRGKKHR